MKCRWAAGVLLSVVGAGCSQSVRPEATVPPPSSTSIPWTPGLVDELECGDDSDCPDGFRLDGTTYWLECEVVRAELIGSPAATDGAPEFAPVYAIDGIQPELMLALTTPRCPQVGWVAGIRAHEGDEAFRSVADAACVAFVEPPEFWECQ